MVPPRPCFGKSETCRYLEQIKRMRHEGKNILDLTMGSGSLVLLVNFQTDNL
jgi:hypothetical protein